VTDDGDAAPPSTVAHDVTFAVEYDVELRPLALPL
jgi:hypothetical protein